MTAQKTTSDIRSKKFPSEGILNSGKEPIPSKRKTSVVETSSSSVHGGRIEPARPVLVKSISFPFLCEPNHSSLQPQPDLEPGQGAETRRDLNEELWQFFLNAPETKIGDSPDDDNNDDDDDNHDDELL